ncbi:unnamed protein product [Medioppia subpectinata]|uniref:Peptidase C45 hydrolase domain-containing protein n=1 Tax=Medioppia subpectinata TaxID=1979941 RepID=A0A7R9KIK9_9ACAR|nr:unnamed protein product [Medioppia subpectinata]CAG2103074.1 unnamed protein product [Medioppia subpectinata]
MTANVKESYDHIIVRGNPFTRGHSYGQQTKEKIVSNINYYKTSGVLPDWPQVCDYINNHYMKALEKHYPLGLNEMKGIAIGANVSLEEIVLLNARYEMLIWSRLLRRTNSKWPQECTGAVCLSKATKSGDILIGQNWDIHSRLMDNDIIVLLEVHPDPEENIAPYFMLTEAGQLGRSGMNANGLGIIAMGLFSSQDHFDESDKTGQYIPITLLRRIFIEAPTFAVALKRMTSLPRHVSCNMMVATAEGEAINIELTPHNCFISYPPLETDVYTHSNHFKSSAFMDNQSVKDSFKIGSTHFRDRQLERELMNRWPNIDDHSFIDSFKNHLGFPESLCLHIPDKGKEYTSTSPKECTVANIVYNLTTKTVRLCKGQPCLGNYRKYQFNYNVNKDNED